MGTSSLASCTWSVCRSTRRAGSPGPRRRACCTTWVMSSCQTVMRRGRPNASARRSCSSGRLGDKRGIAESVVGLGAVAAFEGRAETAARLIWRRRSRPRIARYSTLALQPRRVRALRRRRALRDRPSGVRTCLARRPTAIPRRGHRGSHRRKPSSALALGAQLQRVGGRR